MAKIKSAGSNNKQTFGKRKTGKAVKTYNKHNSKSSYARNSARR